MKEAKENHPFNKLAKPVQRALANAGINNLEELAKLTEKELMKLHGIGKSTLPILKEAIAKKQLSFAK
jgi:DNA-directed RNA polymerase alpha subunit